MAVVWLALAILILVGTYISLPRIAQTSLGVVHTIEEGSPRSTEQPRVSIQQSHSEIYSIGVLTLALLAVLFACFLLGRTAFVEIELAARFAGLADALSVAGESLEKLEKAANILVPGSKYLSVPEIFSTKDLGSLLNAVKELRK
jgi:hypothetical protein